MVTGNRSNTSSRRGEQNKSNVRGGSDAERRAHGKMTREEAGRKGGEAPHPGESGHKSPQKEKQQR